jgi:hypothetical protein
VPICPSADMSSIPVQLSTNDISKIANNYYKKSVEDQLKISKNQTTDSKLNTYANCYINIMNFHFKVI